MGNNLESGLEQISTNEDAIKKEKLLSKFGSFYAAKTELQKEINSLSPAELEQLKKDYPEYDKIEIKPDMITASSSKVSPDNDFLENKRLKEEEHAAKVWEDYKRKSNLN
jgi:hypothetical protein